MSRSASAKQRNWWWTSGCLGLLSILSLCREGVEMVLEYKYLGVHLDNKQLFSKCSMTLQENTGQGVFSKEAKVPQQPQHLAGQTNNEGWFCSWGGSWTLCMLWLRGECCRNSSQSWTIPPTHSTACWLHRGALSARVTVVLHRPPQEILTPSAQ
ncbi:hypothetical protein EXN66_Car013186 [Channa argus]|uniref:Uncharacterized protein n=1 Tax=Channa argus TaxID=215402 RepID=A0A6G1Q5P9_CHAAH|nr:hypothetical protein EXN66_Car013186 [Channa argus]